MLLIGGFDPTCGAGLARDVLVAGSLGACPRALLTAITEQTSEGVRSVEARTPALVGAALDAELTTVPGPAAVKIGMVGTPALADVIARALTRFPGPVIVDPVMGASHGGALFDGPPEALFGLLARADLVTPNAPEAAWLTGRVVASADDAVAAARALGALGARAVLVKGGHLEGDPVTDVLLDAAGNIHRLTAARLPGPSPRGTGCALATTVAVLTARAGPEASLLTSVTAARTHVHDLITRAFSIGKERHLPA